MADDGVLAQDANGNGIIDDVGELLGGPGRSGFAELATLDDNGDGVVDAQDAAWQTLTVWQDRDRDAHTDAGELIGLDAAGITALSVAATAASDSAAGNQVTATGSYTRADGSTATVADVTFRIDNFRTKYLGDTSHAPEVADLPDLKGYGTLSDLRVAA